jgi:hypothetical protein
MLSADYASKYGNTIPLRMWYLKGHDKQAQGLFTEFKPMLDFFENRVGPYPFGDEKMGVVETRTWAWNTRPSTPTATATSNRRSATTGCCITSCRTNGSATR